MRYHRIWLLVEARTSGAKQTFAVDVEEYAVDVEEYEDNGDDAKFFCRRIMDSSEGPWGPPAPWTRRRWFGGKKGVRT